MFISYKGDQYFLFIITENIYTQLNSFTHWLRQLHLLLPEARQAVV